MKTLNHTHGSLVAAILMVAATAHADVLNDQCSSALPISSVTSTAHGTNLLANSIDDAEASCQPDSQGDVWFAYTAACAGLVTLDTLGSGQDDTVLSVYSACGGAEIACNDDDGGELSSRVSFSATAMQSFRIRLASVGAAGHYQLSVSCLEYPANDTCATAAPVTDALPAATGDNRLADANDDAEAGCQGDSQSDVWFEYAATCTGLATVDTAGSGQSDTILSVYGGCGGSEIACNDDDAGGLAARVSFEATVGQVYRIRLGSVEEPGDYRLNVGCVGLPGNDSCAAALAIADGPLAATGNNLLANPSNETEAACQPSSTGDVWFEYVASCNGMAFVDTFGSGQPDPMLSVYSACGGQELACNDDADSELQSALSFGTALGQSYRIRLASIGDPGEYTLNVSCLAVSENDHCMSASVVTNGIPAAEGNNLLASDADDNEADCQPFSEHDVWFTYASTCDGAVTFDTLGSGQSDTILSVYDGCSGNPLACNDDVGGTLHSGVSLLTALGQTFRIRLASAGPPGDYDLNVACLSVPSNETCASAQVVLGGTLAAEGNNMLASTTDDAEAGCQPDSSGDVWFQYTASCDGLVTIDTSGSGQPDTILSVYDACGGAETACNDDVGGDLQARTSFLATMGQTIWIRLASVGAAGDYDLNINCLSPPANESCGTSLHVMDGEPAAEGNNLLASTDDDREAGCQAESSGDVWFDYVASCTGITVVDTLGSGQPDTVLSAYAGCGGAELACNDDAGDGLHSAISFDVSGGATYRIRLASVGEPGDFDVNVSCIGVPNNDSCASAAIIGNGLPAAVGNNLLAPPADDVVPSCSPDSNGDVWYRYVPTCSSTVFVDTFGSPQDDTVLTVYAACGGNEIACNDDAAGADDLLSEVVFEALAGQSYWIRLGSLGSGGGFVLNVTSDCLGDDTGPTLVGCPADVTIACGDPLPAPAMVMAQDNCEGSLPVTMSMTATPSATCSSASDVTRTWTAEDSCGNSAACSQVITVVAESIVVVSAELMGVHQPVTRCIRFVAGSCSNTADAMLSFVDHDGDDANHNGMADATENATNEPSTPVRAVDAEVEIDAGSGSTLCAKDRQHTLYATTDVQLDGTELVATDLLSLVGGDTDNDSDVDINDLTFLMFHYGELAAPGGCAWNGARDADFSNDGVVGSDDFSLLSDNWLTFSTCLCTLPAESPGGGTPDRVSARAFPPEVAARVDRDRDGLIDYKDVEAFEREHQLSNALSSKMTR